jgi:hypothetical protein
MSIPQPLRELLGKLEYLSMIKKDQKICLNDMTFVDAGSWSGSFKRFTTGEGKKSLIMEIDKIIELSITMLDEFYESRFYDLLTSAMSRAKIGLENLVQTYADKPMTVASLRVCINNIDLQLKPSKSKHN